ncbi:TolC family protein [Hyphomonas sp.]|uniref:TolC family protein n=1 Tax=Hyphomonas sp. TaxID=87 RepID=UPI00391BDE69
MTRTVRPLPVRLAGGTALLLLCAGCISVPPAPDLDISEPASTEFRAPASGEPVSAEWWQSFSDPALAGLVERALRASPALRGADFSVAEAEALLRLAILESGPTLSSRAGASAGRQAGAASSRIDASANAALTAGWEFDLFGRLAASIEAARLDTVAVRELRRDIAVSIASETALAYVNLRGAEARLDVARRNVGAQEESLELVRSLFDNGRVTQLDLERAETQYRTTLASLPVFEADREAALSRLAALTGLPASAPGSLPEELLASPGEVPVLSAPIAAGTPEDLLRRRPDIRAAEARIGSALALGDVARANLFPTLTLNAGVSGLLRNRGQAISGTTIGFDIGPAISWSGPDLRQVYARIDASDARTGRLAADYENAVLNALAETETALTDLLTEQRRTPELEAAVAAARRAADLATLRYREGLDSYLGVLDAQRTLLDAEDRLALNRIETARRAIRAYRSLGGIWTDEELGAFRAG